MIGCSFTTINQKLLYFDIFTVILYSFNTIVPNICDPHCIINVQYETEKLCHIFSNRYLVLKTSHHLLNVFNSKSNEYSLISSVTEKAEKASFRIQKGKPLVLSICE